jgi:hypothetical protein
VWVWAWVSLLVSNAESPWVLLALLPLVKTRSGGSDQSLQKEEGEVKEVREVIHKNRGLSRPRPNY